MKSIFKFPPDVPRNSTDSTPSKLVTWQRIVSAALILPFATAGMGWFPLAAQAQIAEQGCPAGTKIGTTNFVRNGNFATSPGTTGQLSPGNPAGFTSALPYVGDATYPFDPRGGLSIQSGAVNYGPVVSGQPFPGDTTTGAPASNTYLYSNPNQKPDGTSAFPNPTIWAQTVTGLQPNTTYQFIGYFYNLLVNSEADNGFPPIIQLQIGTVNGTPTPVTTKQQWIPVKYNFRTTNQTTADLAIVDQANQTYGDDFGLTAIAFQQCIPNLGVAKSAGTPVRNANGTYTIPYTVTVKNYGTDPLSNLQLTDDLTTTFANASNYTIANLQSTTGGTVKSSYDGRTTNPTLLTGTDTLAAGATATVTFNAIVTPGTGANGSGPFNNSVKATATAPGGTAVSDDSVNGTDPDPDNDKDPSNNTSPTIVTLPQTPLLGIAESAGTPTNNNDGSYTVPYTVIVRNYGSTILNNVQVTDNFTSTFASAQGFNIVSGSIAGTNVTVNPNFNGTSNTNLLAGTDSLPIGASRTITFNVRVTPGSNLGTYNNNALGTATGPNATSVTDTSTNGADPAPDPSGDPTKSSVPTPVNFTSTPPIIGIAESAAKPTNNNDGSYTVPYTFVVRNYGTTPLSNVQVKDDFATTFASAKGFNVVSGSIAGTGVTVNPNFNGTSDTNLLTGVDTLQPGQSRTITLNVRVTPGGNLGAYNNNAIATGSSPSAILAQDTSTNGTDPAPDPTGDPTKSSVPTPVTFTNAPRLRLIKRITNVTRSGSQIGGVPFGNVDSDADASAISQAGVNPVGVRTVDPSIPLQSGDEVEYTIYFLSDGTDAINAANLCDPIPTGTSFVTNSVQAQLGNTQLTSNFFSPLAPLPAKNACPNQTNPSGAVLVNLGNLSTTSGGNTGFVRFRVKID